MDKCIMWIHYEWLYNHNKAKHNKTVCIFLGIYCTTTRPIPKCKEYMYEIPGPILKLAKPASRLGHDRKLRVGVGVGGYWRVHQIFTVYPKKYAHSLLCFALLWLCNRLKWIHMKYLSIFIRVALLALPQCQWSKPGGYGKISQCITTTKPSKAATVCIFLGIYCIVKMLQKIVFRYGLDLTTQCVSMCMWALYCMAVHVCVMYRITDNREQSERLET